MIPKLFQKRKPVLIGHRGSPRRMPENTMASFRKAVQEGADGIEFDIRLSKDKKVFVFHDDTLERMTGEKGEFKKTNASDILKINMAPRFGLRQKTGVPRLEEIFKTFGKRLLYYVELKAGGVSRTLACELGLKAMKMIEKFDLIEHCLLVSFNYDLVKWIKKTDPRFYTGYNFDYLKDLKKARKDYFKYLDCLCAKISCLKPILSSEGKKYGINILTWVVNDEKTLKLALKSGVEGFATDDTAGLLALLERKN
jgi:glycerophosphoryl diester phosphodiesterase